MSLTIADLKSFVRAQSRRDPANYDAQSWRADSNLMQAQRRRVYKDFADRWHNVTEQLIPGNYGRLTITDHAVQYCAGQYSPTEIWNAVYNYFTATTNY